MPAPRDLDIRPRRPEASGVRTPSRRRRHVSALLGGLLVGASLAACGDDPNDAPGGSTPATVTESSTAPAGTGPANSGQLSPEAQDEAHPTTPMAPASTDAP